MTLSWTYAPLKSGHGHPEKSGCDYLCPNLLEILVTEAVDVKLDMGQVTELQWNLSITTT